MVSWLGVLHVGGGASSCTIGDIEERGAPNNLIPREDGGGLRAMVFLGPSYQGKGPPHFEPTGVGVDGAEYLKAAKNIYAPGCLSKYGILPDCAP